MRSSQYLKRCLLDQLSVVNRYYINQQGGNDVPMPSENAAPANSDPIPRSHNYNLSLMSQISLSYIAHPLYPPQNNPITPPKSIPRKSNQAFFFPASTALAFAAFFRLLRIITTLKKLPTTAEPKSIRMTGMRMAQTRGGKKSWRGWPWSTNGWWGKRVR